MKRVTEPFRFLDQEEMNSQQQKCENRQDADVDAEKAGQSVAGHILSAAQQLRDPLAHHRDSAGNVGPHFGGRQG